MKRETKQILAFLILGIFLISLVAGVVSAQDESATGKGKAAVTEKARSLFARSTGSLGLKGAFEYLFGTTHTGESPFELAAIKFLFFILVAMLIYSFLDFIPKVGDSSHLKTVIALIISFLATFYITPGEVYGILQSYEAMGIALTSVIPFLIILGFIWEYSKDPTPTKLIGMRLVLILFAAFLVYRLASLYFAPVLYDKAAVWKYAAITYTIIIICVIAVLVWSRKLFMFILSNRIEGYLEESKVMGAAETTARINQLEGLLQQSIEHDGMPPENVFAQQLKEAVESLRKHAKGIAK